MQLKLKALAFAVSLMTLGGTQVALAGTLDDIKARGSLICGTEGTNPRFTLQNPMTRKIEGYEPALCAKVADALGVKIDYKLVSSEARIPELKDGRVDILASLITYTAQRAEQIAYSNTYFAQPFQIAVRTDASIKDFSGLETARIANVKGSLLEPIMAKRFPKAQQMSFDDANQQFLALQQGNVVAMASNVYILRTFQMKVGESTMTILPEALFTAKVGFAVRKNDPEWVAFLNKVLGDLEASGEAEKLYEQYFGDMGLKRSFKVGDPITN